MRKQLAKAKRARAKAAGTEVDHQVAEFESHDLGDDIPAAGAFKVLRRGKSMPTSIVLQPELVAKLKKKAEHRGIGYGSKNDAYAVFRKKLDKGDPPDDWAALVKAAKKV